MEEVVVPPEAARCRLDQFLARALPGLTRSRLQGLVKTGHVLLNGSPTRPAERLRPGDRIRIEQPPPEPDTAEPQDIPLHILHEDADLLVIDKPARLVVHPAAGNRDGTLVNALLHHCRELSGVGGKERPGIVHRLDKDTSGCLVIAKNDRAHQSLSAQFAGRDVEKIYLALASGVLKRKHIVVEQPIGRHPVHRQKMAVTERGRPAKTEFFLLDTLSCGSLVKCVLHTGRTHQIRVHLKHLGHPVLGDKVYGRGGPWQRQMLHAWQLGFTHPSTGRRLHFTSPLPDDFLRAGVTVP